MYNSVKILGSASALALSLDGTKFIALSNRNNSTLFSHSEHNWRRVEIPWKMLRFATSAGFLSANVILVGFSDGELVKYGLQENQVLLRCKQHGCAIFQIAVSPNLIATRGVDGTLVLYDEYLNPTKLDLLREYFINYVAIYDDEVLLAVEGGLLSYHRNSGVLSRISDASSTYRVDRLNGGVLTFTESALTYIADNLVVDIGDKPANAFAAFEKRRGFVVGFEGGIVAAYDHGLNLVATLNTTYGEILDIAGSPDGHFLVGYDQGVISTGFIDFSQAKLRIYE